MTKIRRSQNERRETTRAKLRHATVKMITQRGYVNTTTIDIAKEAGVSRGALLHHYASKTDLIVDAAAEVWNDAIEEVRALSEALSRGHLDIDAFVDGIWYRVFPESAVAVTLDLMSAARSDRELNDRISIHLKNLFEAYDQIAESAFSVTGLTVDQRRVMVFVTTCTIRGLKLQELMNPDPVMTRAVRDTLKVILDQVRSSSNFSNLLPMPVEEEMVVL